MVAEAEWMRRLNAELAHVRALNPLDLEQAQKRAVPFHVSFDLPSVTEPMFVGGQGDPLHD